MSRLLIRAFTALRRDAAQRRITAFRRCQMGSINTFDLKKLQNSFCSDKTYVAMKEMSVFQTLRSPQPSLMRGALHKSLVNKLMWVKPIDYIRLCEKHKKFALTNNISKGECSQMLKSEINTKFLSTMSVTKILNSKLRLKSSCLLSSYVI